MRYWQSQEIVDSRGSFLKSYTHEISGLEKPMELHEVFVSTSSPGVVRGLHLQIKESENYRVIQLLQGRVFDVLLDLRPDSATFCTYETRELVFGLNETLLIPPGVAHGFQAIEESTMLYLTSSSWNPLLDKGVNPINTEIEWPLPISSISERDQRLPSLDDFLVSYQ